jgi:hypothetical protein
MQTETQSHPADLPSDLIWGGRRIAQVLNTSPRRVFGLLEGDKLKGAKKIGGRWCITRRALLAQFESELA